MRLQLCYPAYRSQVSVGHLFHIAHLFGQSAGQNTISMSTVDTCFLDLARNILLDTAVREKSDWALFMDADTFITTCFPVIDMLNTAQDAGAAVIGAPVRLRGLGEYNADVGGRYLKRSEFEGSVREVDRVGTAFMAINCAWIRDHWPKHPWFESRFVDTPDGRPMKMSEDFEFCDGVRARGGKVLLDGRFEPNHAGITTETAVWANINAKVTELTR